MPQAPRHATDAWLRAFGFRIAERKPGKQPVWVKDGTRYRQDEAYAACQLKYEAAKRKAGRTK